MDLRKTLLAACVLSGATLLLPGRGEVDLLSPRPSETLSFEPGELMRISVPDPVGVGRILWALPYTLVNETGRNRQAALEFMLLPGALPLAAPAGETARNDASSWIAATDDARARERVAQVTGLEISSPARMHGLLRAGERRSGVALFEGVPFEAHRLQILVSGLSRATRAEISEKRDPRPETFRENLRTGARVLRYAPTETGFRLLPLIQRLSSLELTSRQDRSEEVFERGADERYRYLDDPILKAGPGTVLLRRWVYHIGYVRGGETAQGRIDYTEEAARGWILSLSEPPDSAPKGE